MEAMGFVEVLFPFWYSRQCRVTVPWAASDYKQQQNNHEHETVSTNSSTDTNGNTTSIDETANTNSIKQGTPSEQKWQGEHIHDGFAGGLEACDAGGGCSHSTNSVK